MREFLFSYRFDGSEWSITIFADDAAQAREKIKMVSLARYDGELMMRVPGFLGAGLFVRAFTWWKNATGATR